MSTLVEVYGLLIMAAIVSVGSVVANACMLHVAVKLYTETLKQASIRELVEK